MTRRQALLIPAAGLLRAQGTAPNLPRNLSYPLRVVEGSITPADMFFIRDHFGEPDLSLEDWTVKIEGHVERPYEMTFSDLLEAPAKKLEAVLECAGNKAGGSAASNGNWEGVSFQALLEAARVRAGARFVMLEAADSGKLFPDTPVAQYVRVMPLEKCTDPASLIAYKLNGRFLPRGNGFPARALFPGWYAMDSVKWLRRILVLNPNDPKAGQEFEAGGMNRLYNRTVIAGSGFASERLSGIQVKSAMAWPGADQTLPAGKHRVWGFAWTGEGRVRAVSVSVNGGQDWSIAKLEGSPGSYSWVRWSFAWIAAPGEYSLLSRAADARGEQPLERDPKRKDGYEANWCLPVHCRVV